MKTDAIQSFQGSPCILALKSLEKDCGNTKCMDLSKSLFHNSFNIHISYVKESNYIRIWDIWLLDFFFNSGNLICRSTGISLYFRESLGVRDNKSRLIEFAYSIDPDELTYDEPPHLSLHLLPCSL